MPKAPSKLTEIFQKRREEVLEKWIKQQARTVGASEDELRRESSEFINLLAGVMESGGGADPTHPQMQAITQFLQGFSRDRGIKGFSPTETATFILSLKDTLLPMAQSLMKSEEDFSREVMPLSALLDRLGLITFESYVAGREEVISRQATDMAELSTPVVKIWDGILALPLIGTLDSKRTMIVMEKLLQKIVDSASTVAILDITGVPMVDTLVANHIMKTVAATRLLGAECIITGVSPAIAQTIVHLGVDLSGVTTRSTMAEGLKLALKMTRQQLDEERGDALEREAPAVKQAKSQREHA
ncbi:MAG TPA: STAS domain-containing protein [Candidatus Manganitrophaceae bacterium]|nr:STAS domain-containing protein [Candidatus Manganitrophaceae bacterium]